MAHRITWDNQGKTVVLQQYVAPATKTDLYELAQASAKLLRTVNHSVHLIIDERDIRLTYSPEDMRALENIVPTNQGQIVVVMPDIMASYKKYVHAIASPVAPQAFTEPWYVNSIDDARKLLQTELEVRYP